MPSFLRKSWETGRRRGAEKSAAQFVSLRHHILKYCAIHNKLQSIHYVRFSTAISAAIDRGIPGYPHKIRCVSNNGGYNCR
jgi:hypothetical protein